MTIGIDVGMKKISAALLYENEIVYVVDKPIYDQKRDGSKVIMAKMLSIIQELFAPQVKGIGLSLLSRLDESRGVVYDIRHIPHWKKVKVKTIIEDTFHVPVIINTDVNCQVLGEKYYGVCKGFDNILCVTIDPHASTSMVINDKLHLIDKKNFEKYTCLSTPNYNCVRNYKKTYQRTIEELDIFTKDFDPGKADPSQWDELGSLLGRLISIMLINYTPKIILLGGSLAKSYPKYSDAIDKYVKQYLPSQVLLRLIFLMSEHENPRPLGAAALVYQAQKITA